MSAPTLAEIYDHITFDNPLLERFYEDLLYLLGGDLQTLLIELRFTEPELITVIVNGSIFARLSNNCKYADAECLAKNLIMSECQKYIYVVDYQERSSEYGGLIIVIAKNDEECYELIVDRRRNDRNHIEYKEAIKSSKRFMLAKNHDSEVVEEFLT